MTNDFFLITKKCLHLKQNFWISCYTKGTSTIIYNGVYLFSFKVQQCQYGEQRGTYLKVTKVVLIQLSYVWDFEKDRETHRRKVSQDTWLCKEVIVIYSNWDQSISRQHHLSQWICRWHDPNADPF